MRSVGLFQCESQDDAKKIKLGYPFHNSIVQSKKCTRLFTFWASIFLMFTDIFYMTASH